MEWAEPVAAWAELVVEVGWEEAGFLVGEQWLRGQADCWILQREETLHKGSKLFWTKPAIFLAKARNGVITGQIISRSMCSSLSLHLEGLSFLLNYVLHIFQNKVQYMPPSESLSLVTIPFSQSIL